MPAYKLMKKSKLVVLALALVLAAAFSTSCNPITEEKVWAHIAEYKEQYQQKFLDHFNENEEIFNKITATIAAFRDNTEDIENYGNITLKNDAPYGDKGNEDRYIFFTAHQINPLKVDFTDDKTINVFDIKEEELNRIFLAAENYEYNEEKNYYNINASVKYKELSCISEDYIRFEYFAYGMFEKNDRVETALIYDITEPPEDRGDYRYDIFTINDYWYIEYHYYISPAI